MSIGRMVMCLIWCVGIGAPVYALEWERTEVLFQSPTGHTVTSFAFSFTNTSAKEITITGIQTNCQCTSTRLDKKTYAPGEKGVLHVDFDATGLTGRVTRQIIVTTDRPERRRTELTIKTEIIEPITLTPRMLRWKQSALPEAKTVDVQINLSKGVEIACAIANRGDFNIKLVTIEAGRRYQLTVTPDNTREVRTAIISLSPAGVVPPATALTVFAQIR